MSFLRRTRLVLVSIVISFLVLTIAGCGGGGGSSSGASSSGSLASGNGTGGGGYAPIEPPPDELRSTVALKSGASILSSETVSKLLSVQNDQYYHFSLDAAELLTLQPGNVVASLSKTSFLVKIVSVTATSTDIVLDTQPASIDELYTNGEILISASPSLTAKQLKAYNAKLPKGVSLKASPEGKGKFTLTLNNFFASLSTDLPGVLINGKIDLKYHCYFRYKLGLTGVSEFTLYTTQTIEPSLILETGKIKKTFELSKLMHLPAIPLEEVGVPVSLLPVLKINVEASAPGVVLGCSGSVSTKTGASWIKGAGFSPIFEESHSFQPQATLKTAYTGTVTIEPGVTVLLFSLANGPTFTFPFGVEAVIDFGQLPWAKVYSLLGAAIDFRAGINVFGWEVKFQYGYHKEWFLPKALIWQSEGAAGSGSTPPATGPGGTSTVGTSTGSAGTSTGTGRTTLPTPPQSPNPPQLQSPAQDATLIGELTLQWAGQGGPNASGRYKLFVYDSKGNEVLVRDWDTSTSVRWTPPSAGRYTWLVSAEATAGANVASSSTRSFMVKDPPPNPPSLLNPANGFSTTTTVAFQWQGQGGASANGTYAIYVYDSAGKSVLDRGWFPDTGLLWTPPHSGTYTWKVKAGAKESADTSTSDTRSFTVVYPNATGASVLPRQVITPLSGDFSSAPTSQNGRFKLVFQTDGNLVLYDTYPTIHSTWSSGTAGKGANLCVLQPDGNLALYDANMTSLWSTGTVGSPGNWLSIQDDGNVVMYRPDGSCAWNTGTITNVEMFPSASGHSVLPGQRVEAFYIYSPSKRFFLSFQKATDGNLVLYDTYPSVHPIWSINQPNKNGNLCVMQSDGNLIVYNASGKGIWSSCTNGNNGARLDVQDDGNLVIYSATNAVLWQSRTIIPNPDIYPAATGSSVLSGQRLTNEWMFSSNGRYFLSFQQSDGNVVLYEAASARPLWATKTENKGAYLCAMQADGDLVVYNASGQRLWHSDTAGNPGARLMVQDDGNLVIYKPDNSPIWASRTAQ